VAPTGCGISETTVGGGTVGGGVVGVVEGVDTVSGVSGVVEGCEEGDAEVEVWVDGGGEDEAEAEVEAPLLADVELASGLAVEATCPDCVSVIVDAPLSGGAAAIVPAKTSARRKNLLTRAPSSSWISQVSGPWLLA
jgi:hypothetical protein